MPCSHLSDHKIKFGLEPYKTICEVFVFNASAPTSSKKIWASCFSCNEEFTKLLACLHCVYVGCFKTHVSCHHHKSGHNFFVEFTNGNVFCSLCKDFAYDKDFESIQKQRYLKIKNSFQISKWKPTESEESILKKHKNFIKVLAPTRGIRGLINFGSTCYMNCIMQALLHTPMLRDYFFADKHLCQATKSSDCLVCLFSQLFNKYYSDEDDSLCPVDILDCIWQNAKYFATEKQMDAHEFLMLVLNLLHQFSVPKSTSSEACSCIIDVIFHGEMQSDLVCQSCFNISTKVEPIKDIPLNIPDQPASPNLYECLNHFIRTERLSEINCSTCNSYQEVTKQLTLNILPLVIVIQLKRFEESGIQKKTTFVSFPMELDMSSYMSGHRKKVSSPQTQETPVSNQVSTENQYSLYAVIEHDGCLDDGHYVAYIRKSTDFWFECNDKLVDRAKIENVMGCEGYLLFYHKTILSYV